MRVFPMIIARLSNYMSVLAGILLVIMMGITLTDVIGRFFGKPLIGAYELVSFLGAAVAGLTIPRASLLNAHVNVDFVIEKLPGAAQKILKVITRLLVFFMFLFAAWYFVFMGKNLYLTNTVTMTLKMPFYPVVFGLAVSALIQCLVSVCQIFAEKGEKNE